MSTKVGETLRQAREARSLSLEQVAAATHMRLHYLQALERGDFEALPSAVQARGFLRAYADFLNLDGEALLSLSDGEPTSQPRPTPLEQPETTETIAGEEQSEEIFIRIGNTLRTQRDLLGLSLDDVERHTHLRSRYLEALEAGDLNALPSPVQGRGMLNNYASFLGLDPEPLLLRFADGLQARLAARRADYAESKSVPARRSSTLPAPLRRLFSSDFLIGGALAVFLVIFVLWSAIRIFAIQSGQTSTPTAPSIAEVLLASPTATSTTTPLPPTPTSLPPELLFPTPVLPTDPVSGEPGGSAGQGSVQVYLAVRQRAWLKVLVDGEVEFDGRVLPGSAYNFVGDSQVEILTGNGAALAVFYNQQDLGALGTFGQVVHRIYAPEGVMTPTPTITLTPTPTVPATATPAAQATVPALP